MRSDNCDEKAQCTNTEGSFTCSCHPGYTGDGTECSVVLTVGLLLTVALVLIAVVLMIIAILCGSICVVHKLRKMDAKRFVTRCAHLKCLIHRECAVSLSNILNYTYIQYPMCADFLLHRIVATCYL